MQKNVLPQKKPAEYPALIGVVNARYACVNTLCFVDRAPTEATQERLQGAVVLTSAELAPSLLHAHAIVADDPRALFIDWINQLITVESFLPLSSLIAVPPTIATSAQIHASAQIEAGVFIGADTVIAAGCVIKSGTVIGERVIIRENTVIGCAGIALYKTQDDRVLRFPHLAGIHIGNDTEIGANCVLPRGSMNSSRIGDDVVIGNLCNIGHGANIGNKVWMSVGTLIGGNTHIGAGCTMGMGCTIRDNISIGEKVSVGMGSVVVKDIEANTSVFGNPAKRLPSVEAGPQR